MKSSTLKHLRTSLLLTSVAAILTACAPATHGRMEFVAASDQTVTTSLLASYGGRGQHIIVSNASTETIVLTSLHLKDCENIKNRCEVERMNMTIRPGQEVRVALVEAENRRKSYDFRYSWTWQRAK